MEQLQKLKHFKSLRILKIAVPMLIVGAIMEYFLFVNYSTVTTGHKSLIVVFAYGFFFISIVVLVVLIALSLVVFIVELIELKIDS